MKVKELLEHIKKYKKDNPWYGSYRCAWTRCKCKNKENYGRYGGRGIKLVMKLKDFKYLWFRDKAYLMKKASIDRINPNKNYTLKNCRFIELVENQRMGGKCPTRKKCLLPKFPREHYVELGRKSGIARLAIAKAKEIG